MSVMLQLTDASIRFDEMPDVRSRSLPSGSSVPPPLPSHHDHAPGERGGIRVAADHLAVFPAG